MNKMLLAQNGGDGDFGLPGIRNRAIDPSFGSGDGGAALGLLVARLFRAAVLVGGLALLIMIVWGGISWVTAGGDKGKLEEARSRIVNGIIGMIVLVGTVAIVIFVGEVLGMNLLNPTL